MMSNNTYCKSCKKEKHGQELTTMDTTQELIVVNAIIVMIVVNIRIEKTIT